MDKEFVPPTESLELKELGFNEPCFGYYVDGELRGINLGHEGLGGIKPYYKRFGFHTLCNSDINNTEKSVVTAPTFSQAFRFFREKGYDVNVQKESEGVYFGFYWSGVAWVIVGEGTYEQAELECLRKLIEIVKNKP